MGDIGDMVVMTNSLLLNMAIEVVDLPIEHGDFLWLGERLPVDVNIN